MKISDILEKNHLRNLINEGLFIASVDEANNAEKSGESRPVSLDFPRFQSINTTTFSKEETFERSGKTSEEGGKNMGVIRVTTRPSYYAALAEEEARKNPEPEKDYTGGLFVKILIGGLKDGLKTYQQRKIKQVIAKSLNDQGKYIHDYGYRDDRGYYSWPDFILRQNVITTRVIQQSEINILEKPLSAFAAQGWFPEDVIITFHSEKKDTATLANVVTILDSRSRLIEQALFLKEPMQIMLNGGLAISISLSSFSYPLIEAAAYLIAQASKMATTTGKARMNPCDMSNPKYQMRSWLLRLGFIGKEFERPRKTLLEGLPGDMAFFNEEQKKIAVAKRKAQKLNGFSVKEKGA